MLCHLWILPCRRRHRRRRRRDARRAADRLVRWRAISMRFMAGHTPGPSRFLEPYIDAFGLRKADFLTVIDGMAMDVSGDIRGARLATLDLYCERVASAVGRLSIKVFGMDEVPGFDARPSFGPRAATDQYPARSRRGCRHRQTLSAARISGRSAASRRRSAEQRLHIPASTTFAARSRARRMTIIARRTYHVCTSERHAAHARLMGAVYSQSFRGWKSRVGCRRAMRVSLGNGELLLIVLRTASRR